MGGNSENTPFLILEKEAPEDISGAENEAPEGTDAAGWERGGRLEFFFLRFQSQQGQHPGPAGFTKASSEKPLGPYLIFPRARPKHSYGAEQATGCGEELFFTFQPVGGP